MEQKREFGNRKRKQAGNAGPKKEDWNPITKLGKLVKSGKVSSLEEIFRFSLPIKEPQIVDYFFGKITEDEKNGKYREEVMKVKSVQKQTTAGQRTRLKVWMLVGDENGHIGLGQKSHKEVQGAIKGALLEAKMNLIPVRLGYWGNKIGKPHTIPMKVSGKCGSVTVRLVPAPRGTGVVGAPTTKKCIQFAGIKDCYTQSTGKTKTKGNFLYACYYALRRTYCYLTPEFWGASASDNNLLLTSVKK